MLLFSIFLDDERWMMRKIVLTRFITRLIEYFSPS